MKYYFCILILASSALNSYGQINNVVNNGAGNSNVVNSGNGNPNLTNNNNNLNNIGNTMNNMGNSNNGMNNMGNMNSMSNNMTNTNNSIGNVMNNMGLNNTSNNNINGTGGRQTNYNVGNPDTANITRPCQPYDIDCIRRFFYKHAHCKIRHGPVPDPYYKTETVAYLPRLNLTVTYIPYKITGLNGRIEEFYVDNDTDKLVIAIEFRNFNLSSENTFFRFHRRAKEPIVTKDFSSFFYESVVITAIIPKVKNLQLEKAVVVAFVNDAMPDVQLGPGLFKSNDPQVQATMVQFPDNPQATFGELFLAQAAFYPATYIQYNICDFGMKFL